MDRHTHRTSRSAAAFTMIELLVVIVIMAIASAVVVPHLARSDSFAAQSAARVVFGDILFAQNDAIAQQQTRRIVFDLDNQSYQLTDGSGTTLSAAWLGGSYVVNFGAGTQWPDVTLGSTSFSSNTLEFDDLGTPDAGGTVQLTAGAFAYQITVTPITGRVTVSQVTGD